MDYESTRLTTNCHGRNAWRGRASAARTRSTATFDDGTEYSGVTIAACALTQQELANPIPEEPDDEGAEDHSGDDSRDGGDRARRATPRPRSCPACADDRHPLGPPPVRALRSRCSVSGCAAAAAGVLGVAAAAPLLAVVAGCAAGFANSGST